ncbi:hypothetical protein ACHQM5_023270 [Ranunculus cassubicifolius]
MENFSSRRRVVLASLDRFSSLPTELINIILKFVPIRDVVRTSVLSRFWRCRWMLIPDLVFDARSVPPLGQGNRITKPLDFINHVFLLHNENVSQFEISNYLDRYYPDVDRWLHLLARKLVMKLVLEFRSGNLYKISSSLFACQNLRVLKLRGCILFMPSYAKGLPSLVDLELRRVTFTEETIASLVANSPLTRLVLVSCDGFTHLNIYARNLQVLYIHGRCDSVNFGNTPNLVYAYLGCRPSAGHVQVPRHNGRRLNLRDLLRGLVTVKTLHLHKHFIKILVVCMVPGKLCLTFPRLVKVSLELNLDDSKEILTAVKLLGSSPCLQTMTTTNCSGREVIHLDLNEGVALQRQLKQAGCVLPRLETVALTGFKVRMYEMCFLQYLLANAGVLQTMSVQWAVSFTQNDQVKARLLQNMLQFERASSRAKVVFLN